MGTGTGASAQAADTVATSIRTATATTFGAATRWVKDFTTVPFVDELPQGGKRRRAAPVRRLTVHPRPRTPRHKPRDSAASGRTKGRQRMVRHVRNQRRSE